MSFTHSRPKSDGPRIFTIDIAGAGWMGSSSPMATPTTGSPMRSSDYQLLDAFLQRCAVPAATGVASHHLDELGFSDPECREPATWERVFFRAEQHIASLRLAMKCYLIVPVKVSRTVQTMSTISLSWIQERLAKEPPTLALQPVMISLSREEVEDHRFPIPWHIENLPHSRYLVYYRQFRTKDDVAEGWEYSNGLYFESFPPLRCVYGE